MGEVPVRIDSEKIKDLLKYARERHGAPCRVELSAGPPINTPCQHDPAAINDVCWECYGLVLEINYRDFDPAIFANPINCEDWPLERILI